jgi:hypothetical protein
VFVFPSGDFIQFPQFPVLAMAGKKKDSMRKKAGHGVGGIGCNLEH